MAWARNYMHDKGAVHCDEWEDFFNIHNELANPKTGQSRADARQSTGMCSFSDWYFPISFMLIIVHALAVFLDLFSILIITYMYTVTILYSPS
jgi:hypothetical protein